MSAPSSNGRGTRELQLCTIESVLRLMSEAGQPLDESTKQTIFPHSNGYSTWFIGRETLELGLTTPLKAEEILDLIEAGEGTHAE